MKPPDAARSRALSILVIVACLALGTLMVVRRSGDMWPWFAAVFYGIAAINVTAEMLLWRLASRRRRQREQREARQTTPGDEDRGNTPS